MRRNEKALARTERIIKAIGELDRDRIHILYFKYYICPYNLYRNPLTLATKGLSLFNGKPAIDHVCHISRFVYDRSKKRYNPKIFEATMNKGMAENDLINRLEGFRGTITLETLGKVDRKKARKFENDYRGVAYSKNLALFSGVDLRLIDKSFKKNDGGFCSWLETIFLKDQGYNIGIEDGNALEITPADIYSLDLGRKQTFFEYNV